MFIASQQEIPDAVATDARGVTLSGVERACAAGVRPVMLVALR
jgi:hypothetical protein